MSSFQVVAIPTEVAESVRSTGKAPVYGFPAQRELAAGRAPCRHCLRLIRPQEEELMLFTYDPFRELAQPALPGPIYVHAETCARNTEQTSFPEEYRGRLLTFIAYGDDRKVLQEIRLTSGNEEATAHQLFDNLEVRYVHVRSTEAGCYLFRLDRRAR
jgi:hypothetical protein